MTREIRVLIVDDSVQMRKWLSDILSADEQFHVVGAAQDVREAHALVKHKDPDVLTLGVTTQKIDGLGFLSELMQSNPLPVVIVSTPDRHGTEFTLHALSVGAVGFFSNQKAGHSKGIGRCSDGIHAKLKAAAGARISALSEIAQRANNESQKTKARASSTVSQIAEYRTTNRVIAIGASMGGTEAVKDILVDLSPNSPGIVIAQHLPPVFSQSFADWMNARSALVVCEARDGQQILAGHVFVAPGGRHLKVERDGARYRCRLIEDGPGCEYMPSIDILFDSVAKEVGRNSIGIILAGAGCDGASGLRHMQEQGAKTISQDEQSSVLWEMPGAAVEEGGVDEVLPLHRIANRIRAIEEG